MSTNSKVVLIVEDDNDFRSLLEQLLAKEEYEIESAQDGQEGYEKARSASPNLIITDLAMPNMGGLEFIQKVSSNRNLNHIPIIILSGVDDEGDLKKGLKLGAIDFVQKPFDSETLLLKVRNIMGVREKFQERSWRYLLSKSFQESELSEEEEFMQSVYKVVTEQMGKYEFSVTDLAAELNMSERSLYRRVKALTEHPVAGLIREVRLQRARELVEKKRVKTKSELARMVGFKSPKHFKKAYQQRFGEALNI